jgi:hypothetical protein
MFNNTNFKHSKLTYIDNKKGFAIAMVFFVIMLFVIIGSVLIKNTSNEIPAARMLDKKVDAGYIARSIAEVIRLKIKNFPEEFAEALRDLELHENNSGPTPLTYKTYIDDFNTSTKIKNNFGINDAKIAGRLLGLKRIHIGTPVNSGTSQFVTDVVELKIEVKYQLTKEDFVPKPREVTIELIEEIKFKRRFKPN